MTDQNTTRSRRAASNTVLVLRKTDDGGLDILEVFQPGDETKAPQRAAKAYIAAVSKDENHEYHQDLLEGRIFTLSGHPSAVTVAHEPTVKFG